jgi:hypothetical protein
MDKRAHMQNGKAIDLFFRLSKTVTLVLCVLLLFATQITPLYAQLSPARDLTGTWQSSVSGMYYDMDPSDSSTRMNDLTATFAMDITQQGSQITIILYLNPTSWVTDNAYWQEYQMSGVPPVGGGSIEFVGTVSSSSFTADEQGSQLVQEHLAGTFTTDIITATLTGTGETTDQNGIVVTRTSSPTSTPTLSPTSTPTPNNWGSVALVKGPAWYTNTGVNEPITSQSQIGTGTEVLTGNNAIIGIMSNDGTLQLWENSAMVWVGVEQQSSSNQQVSLKTVQPPPVPTDAIMSSWEGEGLIDEGLGPLGLFIGGTSSLVESSAKPIVVDGLIFLLEGAGHFVSSSNSQDETYHVEPIVVPQGYLVPFPDPEFTVNVSNETTIVQVLNGSVAYLDPVTSNSVIIGPNQTLTLPNQQGFSQQELNADISPSNPNSINQWWTQTTAANSPLNGLIDQPLMLVLVVVLIVAIVAAIVAISRRKGRIQLQQPGEPNQKLSMNNRPMSLKKLVATAIISLVVLTIFGYIFINWFNTTLSSAGSESVGGISLTLVDVIFIGILAFGYIATIVQQIRRYR